MRTTALQIPITIFIYPSVLIFKYCAFSMDEFCAHSLIPPTHTQDSSPLTYVRMDTTLRSIHLPPFLPTYNQVLASPIGKNDK